MNQGELPPGVAPDLAMKLAELGLERNALELALRGYTIIRDVAPLDFFDRLRERIVECVAETNPESEPPETPFWRIAGRLLERGRIFEEAVCNPKLMALTEFSVGKGYIVNSIAGTVRRNATKPLPMHTDYNFMREPFPPFPQVVTALWACDDLTEAGGCTRLVPGSHRYRRHPANGDGESDAIPLECPKGSLVMWDGAAWHGNCARTAPGERVCLHAAFNRMVNRPMEDYSNLPREIIDRNPPEFAAMLGLNDPFGKSTRRGPDLTRSKYASEIFRS